MEANETVSPVSLFLMSLFGVIPVLSFNYLLLSMLVIRCYAVVHKITANGKSIGEVRAFEELKVQERPNGADAFSDCLN